MYTVRQLDLISKDGCAPHLLVEKVEGKERTFKITFAFKNTEVFVVFF